MRRFVLFRFLFVFLIEQINEYGVLGT